MAITVACTEAAATHREREGLRARYTAAVTDTVAAILTGHMGRAADHPAPWRTNPTGRGLTAVDGGSGRYELDTRRARIADLSDDGLGTAEHILGQHLTAKVPDLDGSGGSPAPAARTPASPTTRPCLTCSASGRHVLSRNPHGKVTGLHATVTHITAYTWH
ncbi:hypothetical protein [Streptomyces sp. NPDC058308]|uniref:hypothetical protein n=1 Tax=Streptomyces sp. NPDC058308 TaxID=3346440 RepID=UPI0036EC6A4E